MTPPATTSGRANIVLTGFMGTGKSTVGRLVADRLGLPFIDTDAEIEKVHGRIPEIFAEHGEARFRMLEAELIDELAARAGPTVIATGGGTLIDAVNADKLAATGPVYNLTADADEIVRRVTEDRTEERPLLAGPDATEQVRRLLADRAEAYARFTPVVTGGRRPEAVADEIVADALRRASETPAGPGRNPLATAFVVVVAVLVIVVLAALLL